VLIHRVVRSVFLVAGVAMMSACSIYSLPESSPVPVEDKPDYTEVEPSSPSAPQSTTPAPATPTADPSASVAYAPLLAKAEQATDRGDYEQALALLERAQRIDPDSAEIYFEMAKTHDAKGDYRQARATAERGLLYCTSDAQCDRLRVYTR
jgi:tetratricopeptide (TPR) repeat protein